MTTSPLFAFEMDAGTLTTLLTAGGAACAAFGAGVWKIWDRWDGRADKRRKDRLEDEENARKKKAEDEEAIRKKKAEDDQRNTDYWKDIVTRLDLQNQTMQKESDNCHRRVTKLCQAVIYLYGIARDQGREIQRLGGQSFDMQELSELLDDPDAAAFVHNNVKQGSVLVHQEAQAATSPSFSGPTP